MAPDGADLPVRHVLRAAARRARARRRAVRRLLRSATRTSSSSSRRCIADGDLADRHLAVDRLRRAVLVDRRRLGQSRRHSGAATCSRALIPIGFALLFAAGAARRPSATSSPGGGPTHAAERDPRDPDAGVVLRPADGGHPGRAHAGDRRASCSATSASARCCSTCCRSAHLRRGRPTTTLLAIPLFVFMGVMLEKSRLAEDLMDVIGHLAGGLRGGLGIGIILVGVLMGATTGIVGATVVTLGLLTLPTLLRRGYDKGLACGVICASGTLGQIIPPSLILILLADILQRVGRHAVRRRDDPGPAARRRSTSSTSSCSASCGPTWCRPSRRRSATLISRRASLPASCCKVVAAADRAGGRGAGLDHRRHRRADRGRLHGRARLDPGHRDRPAGCRGQVLRETRAATTRSPR